MAEAKLVDKPIFVLGTGRCGSTSVQRAISCLERVWIWGEHDGILQSLNWLWRSLHGETALSRFHFDAPRKNLLDLIRHRMGDATDLAWVNGFEREDVYRAMAAFIRALFAGNLPRGKSVWGFKEIRYGPDNRVPVMLLDLFPSARIVYSARLAVDTIVSSLAAWKGDVIESAATGDETALGLLAQAHREYSDRWLSYSNYFLELREARPESVFVARLEDFGSTFSSLRRFLDEPMGDIAEADLNLPMNQNKRAPALLSNLIRDRLEEMHAPHRQRFATVEAALGYRR